MDSINESDEEGESPPFSLRRTFPGTGSSPAEGSPQLSPPYRPPSVATSDAESDQYDSEPEHSPRIEAAANSPVRAMLSPPFAHQRVPPVPLVPPVSVLEPSVRLVPLEQGSPGSSVDSSLGETSLVSSFDEHSMLTLRGSIASPSDAALSPLHGYGRKRPGSSHGGGALRRSAEQLASAGVEPAGGPEPQRQRCGGMPSTPLGMPTPSMSTPQGMLGEGPPRSWTPLRAVTPRDARRFELEPRPSQPFSPGDGASSEPSSSPVATPFDRTEPLGAGGAQDGWLFSPDAVPGSSARLCACFVSPEAGTAAGTAAGTDAGTAADTSPGASPTLGASPTPFAPPTPRATLSMRTASPSPPRRPGTSLDGNVQWHPGEPHDSLSWERGPASRARTESTSSHESMLSHPDELEGEGLMGQPEGIMGRRYSMVQGEMAPSPQHHHHGEGGAEGGDTEGGGAVVPQLFSYSK